MKIKKSLIAFFLTSPVFILAFNFNTEKEGIRTYETGSIDTTNTALIKPCVTFCFDGAYTEEIEVIAPLFKQEGIIATSFVETSTIGTKRVMTQSQLLDLQNKYEWEIGSHTVTHPSLPLLTSEQIEKELRDSKETLTKMGFVVNNLAYSNGDYDERVMAIARKYYNTASKTLQDEVTNSIPINTFALIRASSNDGTTLDQYKKYVDYSLTHTRWFIVYAHAFQYTPETIQILQDLIKYIKSKNMDILSIQQGYERFANKVDFGYQGRNKFIAAEKNKYDYLGQYFYVDATNQSESSNLNINSFKATKLLEEYPKDVVTLFKVDSLGSIGFPNNKSGIVETYNFGLNGIDRQEFYQPNPEELWLRLIDTLTGNWDKWEKIR